MKKLRIDHAHLWTGGDTFEPGSLLISGDRIEAVAIRGELLPDDLAEGARRIDLGGAWVLPGFIDGHFHLTSLALKTLRCDLYSARSAEDAAARLAAWAGEHDDPWVVGVEWDETAWVTDDLPTRAMLDAVDRKRPVLARRICGHVGVANTALLDTLSSHPGLIDSDSGVIKEHALWEAGRRLAPSSTALSTAFEPAIRALHRLGVTGIHDIVDPEKLEGYIDGLASSAARLRVDVLVHGDPADMDAYAARFDRLDPAYVRVSGVKTFLDGSLGARTAALHEPYADRNGRGTLLVETPELRRFARACFERGLTCAMHAIGDRALDQALEVLEGFPAGARHFRIEHAEIVGPRQLETLCRRPVYLAMQPNFIRNWGQPGGLYEQRLGKDRLRRCNPFRTLADAGVDYLFSSDGMPPGPLFGIPGATAHPREAERLTRAEAVERYTVAPHRLGLRPRSGGVLEADHVADFVVFDDNPFTGELERMNLIQTYIGGKPTFDREPQAPD